MWKEGERKRERAHVCALSCSMEDFTTVHDECMRQVSGEMKAGHTVQENGIRGFKIVAPHSIVKSDVQPELTGTRERKAPLQNTAFSTDFSMF